MPESVPTHVSKANYDILAVDVDGTLLNRHGEIPEANLNAIQQARDAGIEIILCTGRSYMEAKHVADALDLNGVGVFVGGAITVNLATGETLRRSSMELELVRPLVKLLNEATGHLVLLLKDRSVTGVDYRLAGEGVIDVASQWWFQQVPVKYDLCASADDDPHPNDTCRISIVTTSREMKGLAAQVRERFAESTFIHDFPVLSKDGNGRHLADDAIHLLEVFRADTNKWTAIAAHAEARGIPVERVATIGDEINDLDLIRNAGLGIAVGNGLESVRSVADCVTETNDNAGVAVAINHILNGKW